MPLRGVPVRPAIIVAPYNRRKINCGSNIKIYKRNMKALEIRMRSIVGKLIKKINKYVN
jgi:hypothetical protein